MKIFSTLFSLSCIAATGSLVAAQTPQVPVPWLISDLSISNVRHGTGGLYVSFLFPNRDKERKVLFNRLTPCKAGPSTSSTLPPRLPRALTQPAHILLTRHTSSLSTTHPIMHPVQIPASILDSTLSVSDLSSTSHISTLPARAPMGRNRASIAANGYSVPMM